MKNKINIVELLKDCPKGTKLYSPLCGDCELNISNKFITVISRGREYTFDEYGCFMGSPECLLFPSKEKREWDTFQPFKVGPNFKDGNWITNGEYTWKVISVDNFDYTLQNQLGEYVEDTINYVNKAFHLWTIKDAKVGDVIFCDDGWTCIFKRIHGIWFSSYCFITCDGEFHTGYEEHAVDSTINGNAHPATKEQCNLLFQKMEEAGYKWNSETKTLERLPKFKVGDEIVEKDNPFKYWYVQGIDTYCNSDFYYIVTKGQVSNLHFKDQDNWELVPNKFDISTLKAYDKVLVRDTNEQVWVADLFSHVLDRPLGGYTFACVGHYPYQCIPYLGNEHLLGTTNDCDEYFKNWE